MLLYIYRILQGKEKLKLNQRQNKRSGNVLDSKLKGNGFCHLAKCHRFDPLRDTCIRGVPWCAAEVCVGTIS